MRTDKREELAAFTVDCLAETLAAHGRGTSGSSSLFPPTRATEHRLRGAAEPAPSAGL
jgi:hypothetical protein